MNKTYEKVGLENIAEGAALDLFEADLKKVLANIEDINTEVSKARSITLTVTFKPDRDRETAQVTVSSKANLAPLNAAETKITVARDKGKLTAFESRKQEPIGNVVEGGF